MLKRSLLPALVLFSFINVCAYGGGWFDFFVPRSNPEDALRSIAQQWMRERRGLAVGTSDGNMREVVRNPLADQRPQADFEYLQRIIGWNALLQEMDALMDMELSQSDLLRREALVQMLVNTFCTQFGCASYAHIEGRLLQTLRSGAIRWSSLRSSIVRTIGDYESHIRRRIRGDAIGYWSCLVRLLSQQCLPSLLQRLNAPGVEGDTVEEQMGRNFATQALRYIESLFQEGGFLRNYNGDLNQWVGLRQALQGGSTIALQIRRAVALNTLEQGELAANGDNGSVQTGPTTVLNGDDSGDEGGLNNDDESKDDSSDDLDKGEDEKREDDQDDVGDDDADLLNVARDYIAWRALEAELAEIVELGVPEGIELARMVLDQFLAMRGYGLNNDLALQAEAILNQMRSSLDLVGDWKALRQQMQAFQATLLAALEPLLDDGERLVQYYLERIINPAITCLWARDGSTVNGLVTLNIQGQILDAVMAFLEDRSLEDRLPFGQRARIYGALRLIRTQGQLVDNRAQALLLIAKVLEERQRKEKEEAEANAVIGVDEQEAEDRQIIGGNGEYCERLLPPEIWVRILGELFRRGNLSDVIRFISSSLCLHGLALCPRYERIYRNDGSYEEVPATRNLFTEFGYRCLALQRYEEAFCYFAYMGCLGTLLEDNFSGMLEAVWQRNQSGGSISIHDLFQIQRIVADGSVRPVCQALNMQNAPIVALESRLMIRSRLIERIFDVVLLAQQAHDQTVNADLPIAQRTAALARLQALLRYQRDQDIPVGHIWEMHEVILTEGFTLDEVQGVIDTLKRLCLSRAFSKKKIDVNMVHSILTNLVHIAASMGPVPVDEARRIYALQTLKEIVKTLPARYFKVYRKYLRQIYTSAGDLELLFLEAGEGAVYVLATEIITLMNQRQHNPQIIEVTGDDNDL